MIFFILKKNYTIIYSKYYCLQKKKKKKSIIVSFLSYNMHFFFSMYNSFILGQLRFFFFLKRELLRLYVPERYKYITK